MKQINKNDVIYLFEELWPGMYNSSHYLENCLNTFDSIHSYFKMYSTDHDKLLNSLATLDGIGITIASGLIWSVYRNDRVPFDKFTTTYAIKKNIIVNNRVSLNFTNYSIKIKEYCDGFEIDGSDFGIEDFVREALCEMELSEYVISPI